MTDNVELKPCRDCEEQQFHAPDCKFIDHRLRLCPACKAMEYPPASCNHILDSERRGNTRSPRDAWNKAIAIVNEYELSDEQVINRGDVAHNTALAWVRKRLEAARDASGDVAAAQVEPQTLFRDFIAFCKRSGLLGTRDLETAYVAGRADQSKLAATSSVDKDSIIRRCAAIAASYKDSIGNTAANIEAAILALAGLGVEEREAQLTSNDKHLGQLVMLVLQQDFTEAHELASQIKVEFPAGSPVAIRDN